MALSKPFAVNGNKVDIPLEKTDDGSMNYEEGFGPRYEQPIKAVIDEKGNITSTGGLQIQRPQFNGLMNALSQAIIENQERIVANHQHIVKVENTMSGCAFLAKDNKFGGLNSFSGATSFKAEVSFNANASFDTADFNTISAAAIHSNTIKTNSISATSAYIQKATLESINTKNIAVSASASIKDLSVSAASIDSLSIKVNPKVLKPLVYSAMASNMLLTKETLESKIINESVIYSAQGDDLIVTKGALEKQLKSLKEIISAMAANINGGTASFDVLKVKSLEVISATATQIDTGNIRADTIYTRRAIVSSGAGGIPVIKWSDADSGGDMDYIFKDPEVMEGQVIESFLDSFSIILKSRFGSYSGVGAKRLTLILDDNTLVYATSASKYVIDGEEYPFTYTWTPNLGVYTYNNVAQTSNYGTNNIFNNSGYGYMSNTFVAGAEFKLQFTNPLPLSKIKGISMINRSSNSSFAGFGSCDVVFRDTRGNEQTIHKLSLNNSLTSFNAYINAINTTDKTEPTETTN